MADPVEGQAQATQDQGSQTDGTKPSAAVEVPEYLSGVITPEEFAATPERERERLSELGKRLYGDYTRKSQAVAELRRIQEDLEADPEKATHLKKAMTEYEARKAGLLPKSSASEVVKSRLERLLEGASSDQQQAVNSLVEALDERYKTDLAEKEKKLTELEVTVKSLLSNTQSSRREVLEAELGVLPEGFKPLVEKYRATILAAGIRTDGNSYSARKLLQIVSSPEEYEQALLVSAPERAKQAVEKARQTATNKPSAAVPAVETIEGKRLPSRDARFKKGPIDIGSMLSDVFGTVKKGMGVG